MTEIFRTSYDVFKLAGEMHQVYHFTRSDGYVAGCGGSDFIYTVAITDPIEVSDFIINLYPTSIEVMSEDDTLAYPTLINNSMTKKNFDILDTVIYIGTAVTGTLDSDAKWTIKKYTLVDGSITEKVSTKEAKAIWINRDFEDYY